MIRLQVLDLVGPEAYTAGYVVITTVDSRLQAAAVSALREGLMEYDRRHGYRGPLAKIDMPGADETADLAELLAGYRAGPGMQIGLVTAVEDQTAQVLVPGHGTLVLPWEGLDWARAFIDDNTRGPEPAVAADILSVGDLIEVSPMENGDWRLSQAPTVQGAIVAVDPIDGAVAALSGGFDFEASKYNRAAQARRQPGSSFKPFIYSAALENGFTTATVSTMRRSYSRMISWKAPGVRKTTVSVFMVRPGCAKRWYDRAIWFPSACSARWVWVTPSTTSPRSASPSPRCPVICHWHWAA